MPCFMSIAFNNSFSPRKRAISSSCFFFSSATRLSLVCDAFSMLLIQLIIILFSLYYSVRSSKWFNISLIHIIHSDITLHFVFLEAFEHIRRLLIEFHLLIDFRSQQYSSVHLHQFQQYHHQLELYCLIS